MAKPIYVVGPNSTHLNLNSSNVVAIRPIAVGEDYSLCLTDAGRFIRLKGSRIAGIGVEKHVIALGYTKAAASHPMATKLADKIAILDGIELVEKASQDRAVVLQREFGGQRVRYVPFDPAQEIMTAEITPPDNSFCVAMGLANGLSAGVVKVQYRADAERKHDIVLCDGWIVPLDEDPTLLPRSSSYGGLLEEAAFVIANAGLARLSGAMQVQVEPDANDKFPRGSLRLDMINSSDYIIVGVDAGDELVVRYIRDDCELAHERLGVDPFHCSHLRLADFVGAIAAVIVMERAIREAPAPRMKKKAA